MNENSKVSLGIARDYVENLAKLSTRKMAMTPVEDVLRELSEVVYHVGEAIVQQLADDSAKAQSDYEKAA